MLPEGRAYIRRFVHPSHFCPEHIPKSIESNLMKLDTLIKDHEGNAEYKNHNPVTSIYGVTSLLNFCNKACPEHKV